MKKIIILLFGILSFHSYGQTKFGHINTEELLKIMPERIEAEDKYVKYVKGLESQLVSMQDELQAKYEEYQENVGSYSEIQKQNKENEIKDLEKRFQSFQKNAADSIQKKEIQLLEPILKKIQDAINEVAKKQGFTYIFNNSNSGNLLYAKESENILELVKKQLRL